MGYDEEKAQSELSDLVMIGPNEVLAGEAAMEIDLKQGWMTVELVSKVHAPPAPYVPAPPSGYALVPVNAQYPVEPLTDKTFLQVCPRCWALVSSMWASQTKHMSWHEGLGH